MATPDVSNTSTVHGYHLSSNQNRSNIGFGRCAKENTPSASDVVCSGNNFGISKVDCSQYWRKTVRTAPPGVSGFVGDSGIKDLLLVVCARMKATDVVHQGIFESPFSEEWSETDPESQGHAVVIYHIIWLCDFPADSVMVQYIDQWST
jgi:hypothetical protein